MILTKKHLHAIIESTIKEVTEQSTHEDYQSLQDEIATACYDAISENLVADDVTFLSDNIVSNLMKSFGEDLERLNAPTIDYMEMNQSFKKAISDKVLSALQPIIDLIVKQTVQDLIEKMTQGLGMPEY